MADNDPTSFSDGKRGGEGRKEEEGEPKKIDLLLRQRLIDSVPS